MSSASGSFLAVRYLEETVPGTIETGNPQLYDCTDASLDQTVQSQPSKVIRSDGQVPDTFLTQGSVGGDLNIELNLKNHDTFLEALMRDVWKTVGTDGVATVADAVFAAATHEITSASSALPALVKGQWFQIKGSNNNNGIFRCSITVAPTTDSITVDVAVKDVVDESAVSVSLSSSRLSTANNGDLRTFSIETENSDVSQFFMHTYCSPSSLKLDLKNGAATGAFSFTGATRKRATATAFPSGIVSSIPAPSTPTISTVHETLVLLDDTALGESCAESFSLTIGNGLKEQRCLGSGIGISQLKKGTFDIKGSLSIYFGASSSAAAYDNMVADTPMSFSMCVVDANGDGYAFNFERAKITSSKITNGGTDADVIMAVDLMATIGANTGAMLTIDRLGSVA